MEVYPTAAGVFSVHGECAVDSWVKYAEFVPWLAGLTWFVYFILQVDVVCGEHLLDRYQSLREVQNVLGEGALQVCIQNVLFSPEVHGERGHSTEPSSADSEQALSLSPWKLYLMLFSLRYVNTYEVALKTIAASYSQKGCFSQAWAELGSVQSKRLTECLWPAKAFPFHFSHNDSALQGSAIFIPWLKLALQLISESLTSEILFPVFKLCFMLLNCKTSNYGAEMIWVQPLWYSESREEQGFGSVKARRRGRVHMCFSLSTESWV